MNKLTIGFAVAALMVGLVIGFFSARYSLVNPSVNSSQNADSTGMGLSAADESQAVLQKQLAESEAREVLLQGEIHGLEQQLEQALEEASYRQSQAHLDEQSLGASAAVLELSAEELFAEQQMKIREAQYSDAMLAIESGDVPEATALLYGLLNSATNDEQRAQAEQGLLALFKSSYERQRSIGNQTHAALWSLFEMHKLQPTAELNYEIISLSEQAYAEAQQYQVEGDLLASADRLSSLMHLSKMVGYEITSNNGEQRNAAAFSRELNQVERQSEYLPLLQARAEMNLYNGTERERANVFWDFTKLATLQGRESMNVASFREQFIESTVAHLEYLQTTNRPGDVRSRMDYIRYVFPTIAKEPEVQRFN